MLIYGVAPKCFRWPYSDTVAEYAASPSLNLLWLASLTDSPDQNPGTNEFGTKEFWAADMVEERG